MLLFTKRAIVPLASALLLAFGLSSCQKSESNSFTGDRGYLPTTIGKFVVYDVDSVVYDDFNSDTIYTHYQMRYDIADTFRDSKNDLSYTVQTSLRKADTMEWTPGEVFYITPQESSIDVVMQNLRFKKLVFPVKEGVTWAGNSQIPALDEDYQYFNDWTYQYQNAGQSYNNGRVNFEHTVTVLQRDEQQNDPATQPDAYSFRTYSREVYASEVGMVYRELTHWIYDPGVKKALKGYSVVMRATDHN